MVKFIILFQGRTGSSFIRDRLYGCSRIKIDGEVFSIDAQRCFKETDAWTKRLKLEYTQGVQYKYLQELVDFKHPDILACGVKTQFKDVVLHPSYFFTFIEENQIRVIHSYRENFIKHAVSRINAERIFARDNCWNLWGNQSPLEPLHVNIPVFDAHLQSVEWDAAVIRVFLQDIRTPVFPLPYENLVGDEDAVFRSIFDFIEVPYEVTPVTIKKATPDNLRLALENYDEVRAFYAGTKYASMLDEGAGG